jgi:hypothetical protein
VFPDLADDVAHDNTYWRCPVSGELLPVVPGSQRLGWMAERRRLFDRRSIEVVSASSDHDITPTPEPTSEPAFVALERDIEPTEPAALSPVPLVLSEHNQRLPVVEVNAPRVDWSAVSVWLSSWMAEYWRVPLALAVALFLIIVSW